MPGKTLFVAAMQTTNDDRPVRVKLPVVKEFRKPEIASWTGQNLVQGSRVVSDRLACFTALAENGCQHDSVVMRWRVCGGSQFAVILGEHGARLSKNALRST